MTSFIESTLQSLFSSSFIMVLIIALGCLVGCVNIKGLSLGTAGVVFVAMLFGIAANYAPYISIGGKNFVLYLANDLRLSDGSVLAENKSIFDLLSGLGTMMFVASVGLTAGPHFFRSFNKAKVCFMIIGIVVATAGFISTLAILLFPGNIEADSSLMAGIFAGALTSTPGLAAAKEIAANQDYAVVGYGVAYLFGVLGVVLFVQLIPRMSHVDMTQERNRAIMENKFTFLPAKLDLSEIDSMGLTQLFLVSILGCLIGSLEIPVIHFSLGNSGGILVAGVLIGHVGHIGKYNLCPDKHTLDFFRELGLCFFLVGAGVPAGANFIQNVHAIFFLYGAVITIIPMVIGYFMVHKILKLGVFNGLGSITGGMTSTPALEALIKSAGTDEVISAYAATYPIALVCVVLFSRIIVSFF